MPNILNSLRFLNTIDFKTRENRIIFQRPSGSPNSTPSETSDSSTETLNENDLEQEIFENLHDFEGICAIKEIADNNLNNIDEGYFQLAYLILKLRGKEEITKKKIGANKTDLDHYFTNPDPEKLRTFGFFYDQGEQRWEMNDGPIIDTDLTPKSKYNTSELIENLKSQYSKDEISGNYNGEYIDTTLQSEAKLQILKTTLDRLETIKKFTKKHPNENFKNYIQKLNEKRNQKLKQISEKLKENKKNNTKTQTEEALEKLLTTTEFPKTESLAALYALAKTQDFKDKPTFEELTKHFTKNKKETNGLYFEHGRWYLINLQFQIGTGDNINFQYLEKKLKNPIFTMSEKYHEIAQKLFTGQKGYEKLQTLLTKEIENEETKNTSKELIEALTAGSINWEQLDDNEKPLLNKISIFQNKNSQDLYFLYISNEKIYAWDKNTEKHYTLKSETNEWEETSNFSLNETEYANINLDNTRTHSLQIIETIKKTTQLPEIKKLDPYIKLTQSTISFSTYEELKINVQNILEKTYGSYATIPFETAKTCAKLRAEAITQETKTNYPEIKTTKSYTLDLSKLKNPKLVGAPIDKKRAEQAEKAAKDVQAIIQKTEEKDSNPLNIFAKIIPALDIMTTTVKNGGGPIAGFIAGITFLFGNKENLIKRVTNAIQKKGTFLEKAKNFFTETLDSFTKGTVETNKIISNQELKNPIKLTGNFKTEAGKFLLIKNNSEFKLPRDERALDFVDEEGNKILAYNNKAIHQKSGALLIPPGTLIPEGTYIPKGSVYKDFNITIKEPIQEQPITGVADITPQSPTTTSPTNTGETSIA